MEIEDARIEANSRRNHTYSDYVMHETAATDGVVPRDWRVTVCSSVPRKANI